MFFRLTATGLLLLALAAGCSTTPETFPTAAEAVSTATPAATAATNRTEAAAATNAAPAKPAIRAITPQMPTAGWTKPWWERRHAAKLEEIKKTGGAPVVFLGDSITHFWEASGRAEWNRCFAAGPYRALNLGFSGDRTEHVLWRIAHGELDGYEAKAIVLMLGTNNSGHWTRAEEPPEHTIEGMKAVLAALRAKQPKAKIIVCAIFPRGRNEKDCYRARNAIVNRAVARCADGRNIFWVDFTDRFLAPDGTLAAEVMSDLLHPGPIGYAFWAAEVIPYLEYACAEHPVGLMPNRYPAFVYPGFFDK